MKKKYLLVLLVAFLGCAPISDDDDSPEKTNSEITVDDDNPGKSYSEILVDDFISNINIESREVSEPDYSTMKKSIIEAIESEDLADSEDISKLLPVVSSEALKSLDIITNDSDKIEYLEKISISSMKVLGNRKAEVETGNLKPLVISTSTKIVDNISVVDIDSNYINNSVESVIESFIDNIDLVNIENNSINETISDVIVKSTEAVQSNDLIDNDVKKEVLFNAPSIAIDNTNSQQKEDVLLEVYDNLVDNIQTSTNDSDKIISELSITYELEEKTLSLIEDDSSLSSESIIEQVNEITLLTSIYNKQLVGKSDTGGDLIIIFTPEHMSFYFKKDLSWEYTDYNYTVKGNVITVTFNTGKSIIEDSAKYYFRNNQFCAEKIATGDLFCYNIGGDIDLTEAVPKY